MIRNFICLKLPTALRKAACMLVWLTVMSSTASALAAVEGYSFGEPCQRPPKAVDDFPDPDARDFFQITFHEIGVGGPEWCVFFVQKKNVDPRGGRRVDETVSWVYEASPNGWKISERQGNYDRRAFLVFEPNISLPLLVITRDDRGNAIYPWKYERWNPQTKQLESARPASEPELKRYVGQAVVMYVLNFPLNEQAVRRLKWNSHPPRILQRILQNVGEGSDGHLRDLLGEPLLVDINKPMGDFDLRRASDFALALAIDSIDDKFDRYNRALGARVKGGPILGALHGGSLRVFNDTGVLNGIAIANEFIRRYPQVPEAWWLRAKMAEWAIHRGLGKKWYGYDNTQGLIPDPRKTAVESLQRVIELRGWAGRKGLDRPYPFQPEGLFESKDEYWDHRVLLELLERVRSGRIDIEELGKWHWGLRMTDGLVRASPEMEKFKP